MEIEIVLGKLAPNFVIMIICLKQGDLKSGKDYIC